MKIFINHPLRILFVLLLAGLSLSCSNENKDSAAEIDFFEIINENYHNSDGIVHLGTEVQLEAKRSRTIRQYTWTVESEPEGSNLVFANAHAPSVLFKPVALGEYIIRLQTEDEDGQKDKGEIKFKVVTPESKS